MPKMKLGDVAIEFKDKCNGNGAGLPSVGLEHLVPGEVRLSNWEDNAQNTFTKLFKKGHILFGRRRAYQKKASVAEFEGKCSGDITVIEAKEGVINKDLLPFIIQNDEFFDFAVSKSAGSLSPRVKWSHLKEYEFALPDREEQDKLAELLWAIEENIEAYNKLISYTDELIIAQFIEIFGNPVELIGNYEFKDVLEDQTRLGTKIKKGDYKLQGKYPIIDQSQEFISGYIDNDDGVYEDAPAIIFGDHTRYLKLVKEPFYLGADGVKLLKVIDDEIDTEYMYYYLMLSHIPDTGYNRHFKYVKELKFLKPSKQKQEQFVNIVKQAEASKEMVQKLLKDLKDTKKAIIKKYFG
ncbi:MAG: hypothetical protein GX295_11475 [Syntrophomonadaceae bacterium]|nr:hypothetical protein [Syntrophomonadaceae bacterium]